MKTFGLGFDNKINFGAGEERTIKTLLSLPSNTFFEPLYMIITTPNYILTKIEHFIVGQPPDREEICFLGKIYISNECVGRKLPIGTIGMHSDEYLQFTMINDNGTWGPLGIYLIGILL